MKLKFDCHIHSEKSFDGILSLKSILKKSKNMHLDAVAICDHDIANTEASEGDVLIVPGVELSTVYGHILGLFIEKEPYGETDLDKIKSISESGGIAVLAHPFECCKTDEKFREIIPYIFGLEIFNARADRKNHKANSMAERLNDKLNLPSFAGSDSHIKDEIGLTYMVVDAVEKTVASLKEAILDNRITAIYGKDAIYAYTARSQWTRYRKRDKGVLNKFRWALFSLKCLLTDVVHIKKTYYKEF